MADDPLITVLGHSGLPEGWFLYHLGELVKPIHYKDEKHEPLGWRVEFQHRDGGLLTYAEHPDLDEAMVEAIRLVQERHERYGK